MRQYRLVQFWLSGFEGNTLVSFETEEEFFNYMNSKFSAYSYMNLTDEGVKAAQILKMTCYVCPKVKN